MSANLASPEPRTLNSEPSRKLPPSERDFDIYDAVHVAGCSTWSQARKHEISQTRVRQIIRRVVEWLGEVLPPQAKVAKEQETHLARQIAADRFQRQYEEATTFWNETYASKYAGLRIRITTAQARLGVVGGIVGGLAADAIEGIPVPAWQAPAEDEDAAELNSKSDPPKADAIRESWLPPANFSRRPRGRSKIEIPVELWDPLTFDQLTPEIVAARAAWGSPIHPAVIEQAKQKGRMWPRAEAQSSRHTPCAVAEEKSSSHDGTDASVGPCAVDREGSIHDGTPTRSAGAPVPTTYSPPVEDFSTADDNPASCEAPPATITAESPSTATACDQITADAIGNPANDCAPSQPLLTTPIQLPVTQVEIAPDQPGVVVSSRHTPCAVNPESSSHKGADPSVGPSAVPTENSSNGIGLGTARTH